MIGLFVLYIILNMRYKAKLLDLLDELAFPSDDPIMTSTLTDDEVFEYPEMSTDEEVSTYAEANNVDIATAILETNPEVFVYEEPTNIDPNHGHDLDHIEEVEKEMAVMSDEEWAEMEARAKKHPVPKDSPPWPGRKNGQPEAEIFTEGLEPRRTISFFEPDFPPLTLSQLKRLPKAELIDLCERYGHDTDGTKNDLFKRLVD